MVSSVTSSARPASASRRCSGLGFIYIPEHSVTLAGLCVRPLVDPEITRQIQIVTVRGRPHMPSVGAFVNEALRFPWSSRGATPLPAGA